MDRKNKTDQFFREKLDQIEFQPSDQAWKKIQGSIDSKKTIPWANYLKVAASLALLLTLGYLFYPEPTQQLTIEDVTSPQPLEIAQLNIPEQALYESIALETPSQEPKKVKQKVDVPAIEPIHEQRTIVELAGIDEINISADLIAPAEPKLEKADDKPAVTITYYTARSSETVHDGDSSKVNLLDKMKFFAKNVSAVDLLSDIRTAKEALIENGFKRN
ncbi:MAG: hypothetical protein RLO17_10835 [Cyclobacteriaceae bacterium]